MEDCGCVTTATLTHLVLLVLVSVGLFVWRYGYPRFVGVACPVAPACPLVVAEAPAESFVVPAGGAVSSHGGEVYGAPVKKRG